MHWCQQKWNVNDCANVQNAGALLRNSAKRAIASTKPAELGPIAAEMDALGDRVGFFGIFSWNSD